ncbi:MAG: hypothetical protein H0Z24_08370 [Thermosipho sp. (in: Bacteria)]|nr:hypothetical protein [Thermosipho sp. (in: thermotogales)]
MVKLIKELFEETDKFTKLEYKTLIGYVDHLKELSKLLDNLDAIWKSKVMIRKRRPIIVEPYKNNYYRFIFLSTKNYSKKPINISIFCVINEDEFCRFQKMESFLFQYGVRKKFKLPKYVLKRYFVVCGTCKKSIQEFLMGW